MSTGTQQTAGTNGKGTQALQTAGAGALAADKPRTMRDLIESAKGRFAEVLPKHLSADRLVRVVVACVAKTPALQKCTQTSVLNSVMQAAQLGLEPTGVLGSAYLVPYGNECTLIVGYRGLIDLARRSGQIESIEAHVVHAADKFTCRYGLDPVLEHEPCWEGDPGAVKAVYAIAKLKDGGRQIEVMTRAQVDAIKAKAKSGSGPWKDHYEEMARKTVVRRLAKYLPLSPEMAEALDQVDPEPLIAADQVANAGGVAGLSALAKKAAGQQTVEVEPAHDPETGEVQDDEPSAEEKAEIAAREAAEARA